MSSDIIDVWGYPFNRSKWQPYEFVFRFNRRRSRRCGMVFYRVLELALAHAPVRYQHLIAVQRRLRRGRPRRR